MVKGCEAENLHEFISLLDSARGIDGENPRLSSLCSVESGSSCFACKFPGPNFLKTTSDYQNITVHSVTKCSPSPVISCTEKPQSSNISQVMDANTEHGQSQSSNKSASSGVLRDSARLMEDFLDLAKENTEKDLETCGILGAFLKNGTFYVTTLIIPKQESTSSSCQATNDEEAFAIQNEHSLFPVGWIHTHPSQRCFMSSVDLHTHYSYQVMIPEAFAIVMAPTDTSRSYGIFRLSDPGGMSVVKACQEQGFHPHGETTDGSPVFEHCSNVYKNSNLRFEIFDLR
ncbi:AMSH-like ubiquitin thioesterase 2 isoform X2 [Pyrus x bretschneideri]|uniref:AMSH-like ubiquitin thioesterase 2 isoform X2 n=1 Tax=Pyrus x bretschneideri TaxID=225117 RepID=UPI00202E4CFA|nr:AMSH-like ubiquitin thioesterase 2 isoform X2 [Pyrus x bretschneideri]